MKRRTISLIVALVVLTTILVLSTLKAQENPACNAVASDTTAVLQKVIDSLNAEIKRLSTPSPDTAKVSIPALQQEISQREQNLQQFLADIENRKRQADYLQGAIDVLKGKLGEYQRKAK